MLSQRLAEPQNIIGRDLRYAKRLNLNSTRVWLSYRHYERMGISTMPILWNGNGLDPNTLKPEF